MDGCGKGFDVKNIGLVLTGLAVLVIAGCTQTVECGGTGVTGESFTVYPIGKVEKDGGKTFIVVEKRYQSALLGLEQFSHVTVVYWFDRNDTPAQRAILQVHPQGNRSKPIRGVFATHSPVRPNLIAISRCKILGIKENIIEIEGIDAFDGSPVIDMKN